LARSPDELRDQLWEHFRHRDCYGTIWNVATARESRRDDGLPECLWSTSDARTTPTVAARDSDAVASVDTPPHVEWNAGDLSCGDLVLELRLKLRGLPPGAILHLVALDRGAREDIPAWCRMTGHRLLAAEHPHYRIERKPT
jgi:tRNA 2-thiouridine synthesizing protein A